MSKATKIKMTELSADFLMLIYENDSGDEKKQAAKENARAEIIRRLNAYDVMMCAAKWLENGEDVSKNWYK